MYFICKLLFVAVYATVSSAPPYLALFYDKIMHFSSDQIGILLAIAPFVQFIACPFWAAVVDKKPHYHGSLMGLLCFAGVSAIMVVMYLGIITPDEKNLEFEMPSFLVLTAICIFLYAFCSGTLVSLVDSAVMKILGPNKILYGTFVFGLPNINYMA
jgi:MFS family permease